MALKRRGRVDLAQSVEQSILLIRGEKVILDFVLARMYGVPTKVLLQAVRRNAARFPSDFTYQLAPQEVTRLRSQIVTSKGRGGRRVRPHAFTEQGVAMLSSVLRSEQAIMVDRCFYPVKYCLTCMHISTYNM